MKSLLDFKEPRLNRTWIVLQVADEAEVEVEAAETAAAEGATEEGRTRLALLRKQQVRREVHSAGRVVGVGVLSHTPTSSPRGRRGRG